MATKDGYYGSDDTSNTFMGNGTNWFTLVNKKVGDIDIYEDILDDDKRAGTIFSESGKLEFNPNWFDQDLKHKSFINDNLKIFKNAGSETIKKGLLSADNTLNPEGAGNLAKNLTKTNKADEGSSDNKDALTNPTSVNPFKVGKSEPGTRESDFGIHVFPTTLRTGSGGQDFLKIDMMAYKPTGLKKEMRGKGDNARELALGTEDRDMNRQSIGTVILPIPGGIQDSQQVSWTEDTINPFQLALANIALDTIGQGPKEGAGTATDLVKSALSSEDTKSALGTYIAAQASGAQRLQTRTTGSVMNPNMELLFNAPSIRNFSFAFTLAPRSREEAKTVIRIIRFFKQGMAPIRSKSRLFLKSPHTFRLAYKHKALTGDREGDRNLIASQGTNNAATDHPYLNKFKECAMSTFGVNYTPNGPYSTYEDGVMTAYNITMNFQEMNPIYNDDYGSSGPLPAEIGF